MEAFALVLAAAVAVAVPALATAWAQSKIGPAIAASMAEKPELSTTAILMLAIPETMVILGFVVAVLILFPGSLNRVMALDELVVALEQQAGDEARVLIEKARAGAAELELRSTERLARRRAEGRAALESEHRSRLERGLAEARHEGRRVVLEARDRFLARVQRLAREQLSGAVATPAYREALPGQLAEVLRHLGQGPATLHCHPPLVDQLRALISGKEWLTLAGDPSVATGFTATAADGMLTIGCTLDDHLSRLWPVLAVEVLGQFESGR